MEGGMSIRGYHHMSWEDRKEELAREIVTLLYEKRMIRTFFRDRPSGWTLVSGMYSPLYIQLRPLVSYPAVFDKVCRAMAEMMRHEAGEITKVIGIAMAGVPIAAGMSIAGGIPAGFTRKLEGVKTVESFRELVTSYGEHALVEGELTAGDRIAVVDDLVTRFDSKRIALEQVLYEVKRLDLADVECKTVAVVLDRQQGGLEAAQDAGVKFLGLIPFRTLGLPLLKPVMDDREWEVISHYLSDPEYFQVPEVQRELRLNLS
jgi:orotate phosphoribosyltransferase